MGVISGTGIIEAMPHQPKQSGWSVTLSAIVSEPWGRQASVGLAIAAGVVFLGLLVTVLVTSLGLAMVATGLVLGGIAARKAAMGLFGEDSEATLLALATSVLWGLGLAGAVLRTMAVALIPVGVVLTVVWVLHTL